MMHQTSPRFFQPRGLDRSKSANTTSSSMPITPTISWWTVVPMEGLAGSDMRVIYKTHCKINISGIDNHEVTGLDVVTAATLLKTSLGKVIGIFNEYAYLGKGSSIHSSGQLEWFKTLVDEKSIKVGGTQLITTLDGYSIPLLIRDGLAYATSLEDPQIRTWTHILMSSSHLLMNGIPQSLTMILHTLMDWTPVKSLTSILVTPCLMLMEILMSTLLPTSTSSWMHLQEIVGHTQQSPLFPQSISIRVHPKSLIGMPYVHSLHGHLHPASRTLSMSPPRHGTAPHTQDCIKKHFKSRNPVFNIPRRSEAVAQTPSSLTPLLLMMVQPWPSFSVAVIPLSVMHMASNQPNNSSTPSLITSEKGEPWIPSSVMEANMKSPSESLIFSGLCSFKIISLNLIINIKIRQRIVLDLPSVTPTLS